MKCRKSFEHFLHVITTILRRVECVHQCVVSNPSAPLRSSMMMFHDVMVFSCFHAKVSPFNSLHRCCRLLMLKGSSRAACRHCNQDPGGGAAQAKWCTKRFLRTYHIDIYNVYIHIQYILYMYIIVHQFLTDSIYSRFQHVLIKMIRQRKKKLMSFGFI